MVILRLAVLAVVLALGAGCRIDRASEDVACTAQSDCTMFSGTICSMGYCVRGMLPIDALELDAFVCPEVCNGGCDTSQSTAVCTITGTGAGNITCPAGMHCEIACSTPGACNAITCSNAASCDIDCLVGGACLGITCTTADCDVTCTGTSACGNISCTSGDCTRTCSGDGACGTMSCSGGDCTQACSGGMAACDDLDCGTGKCLVTCTGLEGACEDVRCSNSCQCDVMCSLGTDTCPITMECSDNAPGQDWCTDNQLEGGRCDSSDAVQCRTCQ